MKAKYLLLTGLLCMAAGCSPSISPLTSAPPGTVFEFSYQNELIRLTQGVATAFGCWHDGRCDDLAVETADPRIAQAYIAHLTTTNPWNRQEEVNLSALVVAGVAAGRTKLVVRDGKSSREYTVEVLPAQWEPATAPAPAASPRPIDSSPTPASSSPPVLR